MDGISVLDSSCGYCRSEARALFELADIACMELEEFLWDWHRHVITGHRVPEHMICEGSEAHCPLARRLEGLAGEFTEGERLTVAAEHRRLHSAAALVSRQVAGGGRWTAIDYDSLVRAASCVRSVLWAVRDRLMLRAAMDVLACPGGDTGRVAADAGAGSRKR